MKIKQVSSSDDTDGVYAVTEDGRLLYGYWSLGCIYWQEVTPEENEVQPSPMKDSNESVK